MGFTIIRNIKFGFNRATDVACNLIRHGLLSRDDYVALVSMNDGLYPSEYLGKSLKSILLSLLSQCLNSSNPVTILLIMIYSRQIKTVP